MLEPPCAALPASTFPQRWLLAYLLLYVAPFPLNYIPGLDMLVAVPGVAWQAVVTWVGAVVFAVEAVPRATGSGDTMFDYVQLVCLAVIAIPLAAAWPARLGRGVAWDRLLDRTRAYLRLYLGCYLLVYGLCKAIPTQFPPPGPDRLIVPYGDSSPMGLLWTFMGQSPAYVADGRRPRRRLQRLERRPLPGGGRRVQRQGRPLDPRLRPALVQPDRAPLLRRAGPVTPGCGRSVPR
ncbi:hypothetical protein [Nannocystis bainbridge]|uniref:Uncharacterized protein n=1 Tax=Nannocystis bainbridge TaxID=2995303 RepID=A0ABT5DRD1_9BACT|nr:hypothetical protein [Nannocystis bainbridge]MDC0715715.1 hypothetical protein [Nannocystis bainbridge]